MHKNYYEREKYSCKITNLEALFKICLLFCFVFKLFHLIYWDRVDGVPVVMSNTRPFVTSFMLRGLRMFPWWDWLEFVSYTAW